MKCILSLLLLLFIVNTVLASDQEKEIQNLAKMNLKELTARSQALVAKKFPGENWEKYKFPKFVYINDSVQVGLQDRGQGTPIIGSFYLLLLL